MLLDYVHQIAGQVQYWWWYWWPLLSEKHPATGSSDTDRGDAQVDIGDAGGLGNAVSS